MKSSKDFENLWFRYKMEGEPKNISINHFCMQHGVQFDQFSKWFRSTRQDVVPVVIEGMPGEQPSVETKEEQSEKRMQSDRTHEIMVIIKTRSGLNIQQRNLDYQGLKRLVEKLEGRLAHVRAKFKYALDQGGDRIAERFLELMAEQCIRPLTRERANSLHYASHKGAEVSAIYHTIFLTCKMVGISALDYLKKFFQEVLKGNTDYAALLPATIGLKK